MNILFLHGLAGSPLDWCGTMAHLPGARALTPRINYLAADGQELRGLAERLLHSLPPWFDTTQGVVVGNSLGAALALLLGERFARIMLVAPYVPLPGGRLLMGRLEGGVSMVRRELGRVFHAPHKLHALQVREYERLWFAIRATRRKVKRLRLLKRNASGFEFEERVARYSDKIALVCGRGDVVSPLARVHTLLERHPEVRLHVLEHCGHAVPLERPRALARLLEREWGESQHFEISKEKNSCQGDVKSLKAVLRNTAPGKKILTATA